MIDKIFQTKQAIPAQEADEAHRAADARFNRRPLRRFLLASMAIMSGLALPTQAAILSFAGGFSYDDDLWIKRFSFDHAVEFTAQTWSFGGGVNANGTRINGGGFDPVLALFEDSGEQLLLGLSRGGTDTAGPGANPSGSLVWDAYLDLRLNAGAYTLVLSQDDNLPVGPSWSEGYLYPNDHHFTSQNTSPYQPDALFVLADGSQRDGHWAVDISPFDPITISEPSTLCLLLAGLTCLLMAGFPKIHRQPLKMLESLMPMALKIPRKPSL